MAEKLSFEDLKKCVKELEKEVAEHKKAEEGLRLHSEILDQMTEGVYLLRTSDAVIVYVNEMFESMFGYDRGEVIGKHVSIVNAPSERRPEEVANEIIQSLNEDGTWRGEVHNIKKDGTLFWCCANISTFDHCEFGQVWIGVHQDISDRKEAEKKLSNSLQHAQYLADIVRHASVGIGDGYPDGSVGLCNKAFQQLTGYSEEELKRINWTEVLTPPEWREYEISKLEELRRTKRPVLYEKEYIRKDGSRVSAELVVHSRLGDDRNVKSYFAFITDITKRKQAEEALRESEARYHSLYDTMREGVAIHEVVYDASGEAKDYIILDVNPSYEKILGLKKEKAVGRKASELYGTGQAPYIETYAEVAGSRQPTSFDTYFPPMDKHFSISVFSPRCGQFATVFADITDRKRVEEKLQRAHDELELQVREQTVELVQANEELKREIEERKQVEESLQVKDNAIESSINGFAFAEFGGNLTYVNKAFLRLWGYRTNRDVLGRPAYEFWQQPEKVLEVVELLSAGGAWVGELVAKKSDGSAFDVQVSASMIVDEAGNPTHMMASFLDITERKLADQALRAKEAELRSKAKNLEDVNTALRVLLKRREEDKSELEQKVLSNVKDLVLPYLEGLKKTSLDANQSFCVSILESNLNDIVSPFSHRLSSKYLGLTPTEIRVADLVKEGKTTKEIAEFMNVSAKTIEAHRDNIRKKIGIKHKKTNLRTYLSSLQQ